MLLYGLGGRAVLDRIRRRARGHVVERTLGACSCCSPAMLIAANLDVRFEEALARDTSLPAIFVDPTRGLENSSAVRNRLASLRPASRFATRQHRAAAAVPVATAPGVAIPGVRTPALPQLGPAPDFTRTERWFNTPADRPLSLTRLRGKVVLVDFWTYTCINCIRTLPFLKGLWATYHRYGLQVVGVETPEFTFEQDAGNVAQAIASDGLRYPVVQDNAYGTWNAYQNEYWPAEYLIDAQGQVRHTQFGEGSYRQDEAAVRSLLYAAGARHLPAPMSAHAIVPSSQLATPETYLDPQRAQGFAQPPRAGVHFYPGVINPPLDTFGLHGTWRVTSQSATPTAPGASITARYQAADVYLVLTSAGHRPRTVTVTVDGHRGSAGDRPGAAPLHARAPARRRAPHADRCDTARRQRLRLHLRLSRACAAARSAGVLTLASSSSPTASVAAPARSATPRIGGRGSWARALCSPSSAPGSQRPSSGCTPLSGPRASMAVALAGTGSAASR